MAKLHLQTRWPLNDGNSIPVLGLGVYMAKPGRVTVDAVKTAIGRGYRHIDTASMYGNEADVGRAVRECGVARDELFVTTKLWNDDHGYDEARRAFDLSLGELGLDHIDLYLIHWPVPGLRLETWRALREIRKSGRAKSIGVSNYTIKHLKEIYDEFGEWPSVNQVEFSPFLNQKALLEFCHEKEIVVEAYSPLTRGERLRDRRLVSLAQAHAKSPAQILIRWCLQKGLVPLPKSVHKDRIDENADVFDFELGAQDLAVMDEMNENLHVSWDPTHQR